MAREIARVTTSQNDVLAGVAVLGITSASLGAGIQFTTGGERRTRGNLFILAIAQSGTSKGESFDLAKAPYVAAEREMMEVFDRDERPGLVAAHNVLSARLKKLTAKAAAENDPKNRRELQDEIQCAEREKSEIERKIESAPRLMVGDVTKEQLAVIMQGQPGEALASLSSEARGHFSIVKGRYGKLGGDEDFYCSAYSGDTITVDRVSRGPVRLNEPCLTTLWMTQPDSARDALSHSSMTESGLIPRHLMCDANAEPQVREKAPTPIPDSVKKNWDVLIRSLLSKYRAQTHSPIVATAQPGALEVLAVYEQENVCLRRSDGELHDLAPYVARWSENASKIALVLHCAEHGNLAHEHLIAQETAANAVELMRWFSKRQISVLGASRMAKVNSRFKVLLEVLEANGWIVKMRTLRRSYGFEKGEVERIQKLHPTQFHIATVKPKDGGRPSRVATIFNALRRDTSC